MATNTSGNASTNQMRQPGAPGSLGNSAMPPPQSMIPTPSTAVNPPTILNSQPAVAPPPHFQSPFQTQAFVQAQVQVQSAHPQFQPQSHLQMQTQSIVHGQPQVQNLHSSSPTLSTPSSANAKRAQQKPPVRPAGTPTSASIAAALKSAELTPAARRKKRKLPEKQLPDRVAALLPESALYTQLLEFESRVDAALMRKKIDIQESLKNPPSMQKTLRIYIFNTYANQNKAPHERGPGETPSWSLKIVGRILEDGSEPEPAGGIPKPNHSFPKFSAFFKRITVTLDPTMYPENPTIVWENARSPVQHEGFEIKRIGDKEFTAGIRLEMNYVPEKFKLSPALMEVLGIEVDTRPRILAAIWHYVKARKLQNPADPSFFICDPPLRKVFNEEKMKFTAVSHKISPHLSPPQAIQLEHRIRLSGEMPVGSVAYDVLVDVPFPLQKEMAAFLANTEKHKEIEACDEAISSAIKRIHEHRKRRAFFLGFSQSPVEFINALIASQSKDLKLVAGEASRNAEKERRAEFYNQPWVEDAVIRYLNRKPAGGSDAPGAT
ncbi:SWI/SNF complex component SNF12 homolog [Nymphaea colorata]|nr:SWI/SNF complex component SNF12 homolog [Nymphaea colorata]XP_031479523.1 SWI/SNF complex component SNF12 homolog [Nymphaea colorata]XP_031479524.1 SWI/SNF complex component SNF12 homolog [Nymphaea colorata]XP_049932661.1 SWI/SNF complex component SNF12 homolog [Nymphaea colorata]XP_049932662.1 SWI/SNF complex component SNF12 homolog [Nymphaea colorata]